MLSNWPIAIAVVEEGCRLLWADSKDGNSERQTSYFDLFLFKKKRVLVQRRYAHNLSLPTAAIAAAAARFNFACTSGSIFAVGATAVAAGVGADAEAGLQAFV